MKGIVKKRQMKEVLTLDLKKLMYSSLDKHLLFMRKKRGENPDTLTLKNDGEYYLLCVQTKCQIENKSYC